MVYKKMSAAGIQVTLLTYGDATDFSYQKELEDIKVIPIYDYIGKSRNRWVNLFKSFIIPFKLKTILLSGDCYKTNQMSGSWVPVIAKLLYHRFLIVRSGYEMLRNQLRDEKDWFLKSVKAVACYPIELAAYMSADTIVMSNTSDQGFVNKFFPVNKQKIKLIRNFIDTDLFSEKKVVKNDADNRKILFIGRIEPCKNIDNLIQGAVLAGCRVDIIGKGENDKIEYLKKKYSNSVDFLGVFDNRQLPEIINNYPVVALTSFFECSPKSLLEAMSCGRVVLGSNVDGIKELITDNVTGFLCGVESKSIEEKIERIFHLDPAVLRKTGQNARQFVLSECSIDRVFKLEMDLYSEMFP